MFRILAPAVLAVGVSGCASVVDLPPAYALGGQEREGLAIVSLTVSGRRLDELSRLEYGIREVKRRVGAPMEARRHFDSVRNFARWVVEGGDRRTLDRKVIVIAPRSGEPLDIVGADAATGRVAALPLPAGMYEFYTWKATEPTRYGFQEYGPQGAFSYRFVVRPGRATYIGELELDLAEPDAYRVTAEDRSERDLALLKKKMPSIASETVAVEVGRVEL